MLRTLGYLVVVFFVMLVLRQVPVIGGLFRIPLFGFLLTVAVVGIATERIGTALVARGRYQRMARDLGQVDTPYNRGKLGSLLLSQHRYAAAIEHLKAAAAGEPDSAEWWYRLGAALLGARKPSEAAVALGRAVELNEEHAYGAALLRLVEAWQASGDFEAALATAERHDRAYGPTPESAYRRGLALRALGRRAEANASFDEVARAAAGVARYQKGEARGWMARAFVARRFG